MQPKIVSTRVVKTLIGAAPELDRYLDDLKERARGGLRIVVLRVKRTRNPDMVCMERLRIFIQEMRAQGVAVLVAGSIALMNLYRVARPMNPLRLALVVAMAVAFLAAFVIPAGRDLFDLPTTDGWAYLVAAGLIAAAYPLLVLGTRLAERRTAG